MTLSPAFAAAPERPLFDVCPALRDRVPWLPLGMLPTRVAHASLPLDGQRRDLLIKHDDESGYPYAGNKVRKLEFILAHARDIGAGRLITAGATGSHHALATAIYGAAHGFAVTLVLFPQNRTDHVRETLLLDHALGAELLFTRRMEGVPLALWRARRARAADSPYIVPPGGSDPRGTLGYVNAALEAAVQLEAGDTPRPDRVFVAAGTLGTVAGIALGFALAGLVIPITAVRITSRLVTNEAMLARLCRATARVLAPGAPDDLVGRALALVRLDGSQLGTGYGRATPAAEQATASFAPLGVRLDSTYTAKAAAALVAALRRPDPPRLPLLWHTLSARIPTELLAGVRPEDLPAPFRRYLQGA